jgi:hypothetical protein
MELLIQDTELLMLMMIQRLSLLPLLFFFLR